jgi:ubiquinone/menaquinone biosynthesis C-methylase UbiE
VRQAKTIFRKRRIDIQSANKINICCGNQRIPDYIGIDVATNADICLDLSRRNLPFRDNSLEAVVCMSAINYFDRSRAQELIQEVRRVLKVGGVARFGVQDMKSLAQRYIDGDRRFFFQTLPDGRERFEGPTLGDKFAAWLYGYEIDGSRCRYFYDYDALAYLFKQADFSVVERMAFKQSRLANIDLIDNRPEQMFFLEAVK